MNKLSAQFSDRIYLGQLYCSGQLYNQLNAQLLATGLNIQLYSRLDNSLRDQLDNNLGTDL